MEEHHKVMHELVKTENTYVKKLELLQQVNQLLHNVDMDIYLHNRRLQQLRRIDDETVGLRLFIPHTGMHCHCAVKYNRDIRFFRD